MRRTIVLGRGVGCAALLLTVILTSVGHTAHAARSRASLTTITAVMDWPTPWMGWSPWLVADALGYYRAAGINLKVVPPATVADPAKVLGTGHADIAFTTILDVIEGRAAGASITSVGAYAQYNNWGIITWKSQNIRPEQLKGKTIGVYPDAWSKTQLTIMLQHAGISINQVKLVYTSDDTVPLLLTHKVDVITGVTNAEQTEAEVNGKKPTVDVSRQQVWRAQCLHLGAGRQRQFHEGAPGLDARLDERHRAGPGLRAGAPCSDASPSS